MRIVKNRRTALMVCVVVLSAITLAPATLTQTSALLAGPGGPNTTTLSAGSLETLADGPRRLQEGFRYGPEGVLGVRNVASNYTFFGANGIAPVDPNNWPRGRTARFTGTLADPFGTEADGSYPPVGDDFIEISGLPDDDPPGDRFHYAAGGPLYQAADYLLMTVHLERYYNDMEAPMWASVGLAKSTDGGTTWSFLGEIVQHKVPKATMDPNQSEVGSGPFIVYNDPADGEDYFYVYFTDFQDKTVDPENGCVTRSRNGLAVARANVRDVLQAADSGTVSAWKKYYDSDPSSWGDGTWTEPGLGGSSTELTPDVSWGFFWHDVSYNAFLGKFILYTVGRAPFELVPPVPEPDECGAIPGAVIDTAIQYSESVDGITWSDPIQLPDVPSHDGEGNPLNNDGGADWYATSIGMGGDPRVAGQVSYLYSFAFDYHGAGWPTVGLYRRRLTADNPGAVPYSAYDGHALIQGRSQWTYEYATPGLQDYADMATNVTNWKAPGTSWCLIGATSASVAGTQHPDATCDSVRTWTAPGPGTVEISSRIAKANSGGDGVVASILKNSSSVPVVSLSLGAADTLGQPLNAAGVTVSAGDKIRFRLSAGAAANFTTDQTYWTPLVRFTPAATGASTLVASESFSAYQVQSQFMYEDVAPSAYGADDYQPMDTYDSTNNRWQGRAQWSYVAGNSQHPDSAYDSVRSWVVPRDGTLSVTGTVTRPSTNGATGVTAGIYRDDESSPLAGVTIAAGDTSAHALGLSSVSVSAGDTIRFRVSADGDNTGDATAWDPTVIFTPSS